VLPLGPFDLIKPIAAGGMAEVWRARHREQRIGVAVKVVTARYARNPNFVSRFADEVRAVASLDHPGIVHVLDHGEVDETTAAGSDKLVAGSPWLAMELASGGTLERARPNGWSRLRQTLLGLLDALAHAHARGVIHRDLKPGNVLLATRRDLRPGLKLTDFGIAHARRADTEQSEVVGTPAYMAPEQILGRWRDHGPWTDLYALGCLGWWFTTGGTPFAGRPAADILRAHLRTEAPAFTPHYAVPDELESWLRVLLEKAHTDRFDCAADAAAVLKAMPDVLDETRPAAPLDDDFADTLVATDIALSGTFVLPDLEPDGNRSASRPIPERWQRPEPPQPPMQLVGAGLSLFGLRTVPFVGRDAERDHLWAALRGAATTGRARLVLVRGAAGTGKSRLCDWLCQRAEELGAADVCYADFGEESSPGEAIRLMGERYLKTKRLDRSGVSKRVLHFLSALDVHDADEAAALTEILCPATAADVAADVRPLRLTRPSEYYAVTRRTMMRIASKRPLIAWFDDVQWGLHGLGLALQILHTQDELPFPVLLVLTLRDEALAEGSREARRLQRLLAAPGVQQLPLQPLDTAQHSELVRRLLGLSGPLAARVQERTSGNPLFATQLLASWVRRGLFEVRPEGFVLREGVDMALPDDLHAVWAEAVDAVLTHFPAAARDHLETAAVLGVAVRWPEWKRCCDDPEGHFGDRFPGDDGLRGQLVDVLLTQKLAVGTRSSWSFVHGMLRESILRSAEQRGALRNRHEAAATMLRADSQDLASERLGQHLLGAGRTEEAIEPLLRGVHHRLATVGPNPSADLLALCAQAASQAGLGPQDARRARIALARAAISGAEGKSARAAEHLRTAASISSSDSVAREAQRLAGRLALDEGDHPRAHEAFSALLASPHAFDQAAAAAGLAALALAEGQEDRAEALAERGLVAIGEVRAGAERQQPSIEADLWLLLGQCSESRNDPRAKERFETAREIAARLGFGRVSARAEEHLAIHFIRVGDDTGALAVLRAAASRYEALGSPYAFRCRARMAIRMAHDPDAAWACLAPAAAMAANLGPAAVRATSAGFAMLHAAVEGAWDRFDQARQDTAAALPRRGPAISMVAWLVQTSVVIASREAPAQAAGAARLAERLWAAVDDDVLARPAQLEEGT
jgi:eukaryotic-like serine/threonine-protein kinase